MLFTKPVIFLPRSCSIRTIYNKNRSGLREVVGFGVNGSNVYKDDAHFPFSSIRFQETRGMIISLKLKELGDWKMLCQEDKKMLYRVSFCQTFSEFQHPTGTWRLILGVVLFVTSWGFWLMTYFHLYVQDPLPESLDYFNQKEQLRRMLEIKVNPIDGISSHWNYDRDDWRWKKILKLDD